MIQKSAGEFLSGTRSKNTVCKEYFDIGLEKGQ